MNKQKSYKGWDFLDTCSSEQLNLLKEVLFIDDKKKISIDAKNGAKPPTKNGDTRSLFYHPVLFGGKDTIFSVLNCHN